MKNKIIDNENYAWLRDWSVFMATKALNHKIKKVDDESYALLRDLQGFESARVWNHYLILLAADEPVPFTEGQVSFTEKELESALNELEGAIVDSCLVLDELKKRGLEFDSVDEALNLLTVEEDRRRKESLGGSVNERTEENP